MSIIHIVYLNAIALLLIASVWDLATREIPDWIPIAMLGLAAGSVLCYPSRWKTALTGLLLWGAVLFIVYILSNRKGPETGIGGGDIKLMTPLAALTGVFGFLPMLVVTCASGLLCVPIFRKSVLPLAPCLTAGFCFWYYFC